MARQDPQHFAEFSVLGATATELHRETGTQHAMVLQRNVVLGDEQIFVVAVPGAGSKFRT
jgi:hypothetical protein